MATFNGHVYCEVVDVNGDTATTRMPIHISDTETAAVLAGVATAFGTAVAQASNGKVIRQGFSILTLEAQLLVGTTPPTNAEYSSVTDGARFQFANGNGERSSVTVPAPLEALFGASSNVVDSTQTNAAAFIAQWVADSAAPSGAAYNLYKGGIKVGRRARRRRTALVP